jgi:hypothetical protein
VCQGVLEISVNDDRYLLSTGDSILFYAERTYPTLKKTLRERGADNYLDQGSLSEQNRCRPDGVRQTQFG